MDEKVMTNDQQVERFNAIRENTLEEIRYLASSLRDHLTSMKRDAERAIESLNTGAYVDGSHGFGPIGHQAPFDVSRQSVLLAEAVKLARLLGASEDEITEKYVGRQNWKRIMDERVAEMVAEKVATFEASKR